MWQRKFIHMSRDCLYVRKQKAKKKMFSQFDFLAKTKKVELQKLFCWTKNSVFCSNHVFEKRMKCLFRPEFWLEFDLIKHVWSWIQCRKLEHSNEWIFMESRIVSAWANFDFERNFLTVSQQCSRIRIRAIWHWQASVSTFD